MLLMDFNSMWKSWQSYAIITNVKKSLNLFQIDTSRFPYPEKCIIYLLFSCFSVSVVLLAGFVSGDNSMFLRRIINRSFLNCDVAVIKNPFLPLTHFLKVCFICVSVFLLLIVIPFYFWNTFSRLGKFSRLLAHLLIFVRLEAHFTIIRNCTALVQFYQTFFSPLCIIFVFCC